MTPLTPLSVILSAVKPSISSLKVKVNSLVVSVEEPLAVKAVKLIFLTTTGSLAAAAETAGVLNGESE